MSYNLEWDAGSSGTNWYSLVGNVANSLSLNFLATNSLTPGHAYRFRVRAKNIWGWGPFSPVTTIYAATVPAKMVIPVFTIDSLAGDLKIDWTQPDIQGDAIMSYDIEIANNAQTTWTEYAPSCSGSDPLITFCLVPMVVLEAAPYLYT